MWLFKGNLFSSNINHQVTGTPLGNPSQRADTAQKVTSLERALYGSATTGTHRSLVQNVNIYTKFDEFEFGIGLCTRWKIVCSKRASKKIYMWQWSNCRWDSTDVMINGASTFIYCYPKTANWDRRVLKRYREINASCGWSFLSFSILSSTKYLCGVIKTRRFH